MAEPKKFTILSFVGGGIRGLMSVTILKKLQTHFPHLVRHTDLIAGCSTGSIITSELVAGKTSQDLIDFFTSPKGEIGFYNNMNTNADLPAYSIQDVFDSQFLLHRDKKVSDLKRKVLFVSFNVGGLTTSKEGIQTPTPWEPLMYTNMIPDHGDVLIAKAATSSGAMPGNWAPTRATSTAPSSTTTRRSRRSRWL
ncbi:MAG: patatin-like phospholipase family protein [Methylococcales bacterium]